MSIMAKTPSGYKKIGSAYLGERPVDKVYNANGDVVYALQRELTGVPPLLFKGKEQSELLNYRIYGDTVDGESVGDRTGNLFDENSDSKSGYIDDSGNIGQGANPITTYDYINVMPTENYYLKIGKPAGLTTLRKIRIAYYSQDKNYLSRIIIERVDNGATFETPDNCYYIRLSVDDGNTGIMLNSGSTPLPYEPYGYKVPVTVKGKNLFNENSLISPILVRDHYLSWYFDDEHYLLATDKSIDDRPWSYDYSQIHIALSSGTYTIRLSGVATSNQFAGIYITNSNNDRICSENISGKTSSVMTFTLNTPETIGIEIKVFDGKYRIMLVEGSTPLSYEPYQPPVTTPIYLPEPIKMVGDEAEYVDYAEQKMHRVRKNLWPSIVEQGSVSTAGAYPDNTKRVRSRNVSIEPGTYTISANLLLRVIYAYNDYNKIGVCIDAPLGTYSQSFTVPAGANNISIAMMKKVNNVEVDITPSDFIWGQIEKGSEATIYEPYIENTEVNVTLPALPTIKGTNTMSIDTEVQPSRMDIKGRIKSLT